MIFKFFNMRLLLVLASIIIIPSNVFAGMSKFKGKGPLLLSEDMANIVEYYFSGGKKGAYAQKQSTAWTPYLIVIAEDGSDFAYVTTPAHVDDNNADTRNYVGMALIDCKKKSGKECFLFASRYKIVWDNGSDKKRRKLKRKEIKAGKTLQILQELGFYDPAYSQSSSNLSASKQENSKSTNDKDSKKIFVSGERAMAIQWEGYKDLIVGNINFKVSENVGAFKLRLPKNDGICNGTYALSESKGTWSIMCDNKMSASGTLQWNSSDDSVTGSGKDTNNKSVKFTASGIN
tara:strand:+ start:267 stop:1136 length:870 start_codon:yes stop_codon:yes gene_type:complete